MEYPGQDLFRSYSLADALEQARFLIEDEADNQSVVAVVDGLLARASVEERDLYTLRAVASYVRDVSFVHAGVGCVLLRHLQSLRQPEPFLDILPAMFNMDGVEELSAQLFALVDRRPSTLLQVLATLAELPLSADLWQAVLRVAELALGSLGCADLPALLRVILKSSINSGSGGSGAASRALARVVLAWRRKLRGAPPDGLAVVLEALWQMLPACPSVADLMLEQVLSEQRRRYEMVLGGAVTQEVRVWGVLGGGGGVEGWGGV
ncbi:hypothetical protein B484DRAFT_395241 [Ochromonadaceae sp. CCMP2298]|nr:hypothetical protein B484DRAFT_395241 [Ochromonadaceae sp. CCMP2298]